MSFAGGLGVTPKGGRGPTITIFILHGEDSSSTLVAKRAFNEVRHLIVKQSNEDFTPSHPRSFCRPVKRF